MVHIWQYTISPHNEHNDFIQNRAVFLSIPYVGLNLDRGTDNRSERVKVWYYRVEMVYMSNFKAQTVENNSTIVGPP